MRVSYYLPSQAVGQMSTYVDCEHLFSKNKSLDLAGWLGSDQTISWLCCHCFKNGVKPCSREKERLVSGINPGDIIRVIFV